jgi:predicted TIM-barrel fold metal-dependent hydrolase
MKATIKITQININLSEFGSTQAIMLTYRKNQARFNLSKAVYTSHDFMTRQIEKLTAILLEDVDVTEVTIIDQRAEEIK